MWNPYQEVTCGCGKSRKKASGKVTHEGIDPGEIQTEKMKEEIEEEKKM